ncbi:PREDICTED: uncharacterized protein LOC108557528 [Nicrophorus vespilloides]|uniref:Uncharacterized protein LOC108557528 n=1 Tax=Nicrophorus vespilloides TaxID=110193 RepID=A0ABM1M4Q2_NICVS|nr:PREDICTED: uncharacterized protein LOC108557528 [Nicrophorus vespilloides]
MDLEWNLSCLEISPKRNKRRLSGLHKFIDPCCLQIMLEEEPEDTVQSEKEIETSQEDQSSISMVAKPNLRRSLRGQSPLTVQTEALQVAKSEVEIIDPKKILTVENDLKQIKKIYLNCNKKLKNPSLETIFEDPTGDDKVMSKKKLKRSLTFVDHATRSKVKSKKRLMKAKKITAKKRAQTKISMELFMQKLHDLDSEE